MMTRRFGRYALLAFILVVAAADGASAAAFRFVFMTDIHVMPERHAAEGFAAAIDRVNALAPDFVITGGDLVFDALEADYARADSLYDLYIDLCGRFEMPVYNTIGNHEVFGLYPESGIEETHPEYGKEMFRRRLGGGATCRSFDYGGWHFILLDTIGFTPERRYEGRVAPERLEWLARDLEAVDAGTPIILCLHIPLLSVYLQTKEGGSAGMAPAEAVINSDEVIALFEGRDLRLVLQGHLHIVEQIAIRGTHFVTAGAVCGAWWNGPRDGFPEGFVVVDVDGDAFTYRYETYRWQAGK
jgi:3',5'-cyclic AMP phosphodiesterase CpdA